MSTGINRREFLRQAGLLGVAGALGLEGCASAPRRILSPNEKLNLGVIGTNHRARENIKEVMGENIVALCDIDDNYLAEAHKMFPSAKTYNDFRKLLDQGDLDAVVVATPDHIHAPATLMAMERGLPVYCEKPLTHTVREARLVAELAARKKLPTQMGTQIHAGENYRRVVEVIQAGAIGPVTEVYVWVGKNWAVEGNRPKETPPVPKNIHWDLWLGPAPERPYNPTYIPQSWRRWWDFGSGTLGDMACHYMDLPFWALGLRYPLTVEAKGPQVHPEGAPHDLTVRYEFPARGAQPPVKLTWMDDTLRPAKLKEHKLPVWESGVLFIGSKGMMLADYNQYKLYPEKDFAGYVPPPKTIAPSIGHHAEWIKACKTGSSTTCNFDYSGALTEAVLLGNVSYRIGRKLEWDPKRLRAANCPEAEALIVGKYRKGWEIG